MKSCFTSYVNARTGKKVKAKDRQNDEIVFYIVKDLKNRQIIVNKK